MNYDDEDCGCPRHIRCWRCCPHPPDRIVQSEPGVLVCQDCGDEFVARKPEDVQPDAPEVRP